VVEQQIIKQQVVEQKIIKQQVVKQQIREQQVVEQHDVELPAEGGVANLRRSVGYEGPGWRIVALSCMASIEADRS
jgi:hypothetical protein